MSVQVNGQTRLELREGGHLVQVFVPQQESDRLRAELDEARKQVAHWRGRAEALEGQLDRARHELAFVQRDRDACIEVLRPLLHEKITPLTEAEVAEMRAGTVSLERFLEVAEGVLKETPAGG